MNLLLDTHIYLWWAATPGRLKPKTHRLIDHTENTVFVSVVVLWEMLIKRQKGKLEFEDEVLRPDLAFDFQVLPIELKHLDSYSDLPLVHKDPFDRIMLAQAIAEGLTFVTHDSRCLQYARPNLLLQDASAGH
ncbi:MAG: type II toxin-antitoxin system VapC family toxin [Bacteroidota bacterium]